MACQDSLADEIKIIGGRTEGHAFVQRCEIGHFVIPNFANCTPQQIAALQRVAALGLIIGDQQGQCAFERLFDLVMPVGIHGT
jgi:hypothetical protein